MIEREEEERIRNERRDLLKTAKQIGRLDKERSEQMAEITKLNNSIESLNPWISLDVPLTPAETMFSAMSGCASVIWRTAATALDHQTSAFSSAQPGCAEIKSWSAFPSAASAPLSEIRSALTDVVPMSIPRI